MNKFTLKAAILAQAFVVMSMMLISTVLQPISEAFPKASITQIQLIMSFGMLSGLPVSIFSGWLANYIDKKIIGFLGLTIMMLGGVQAAFFHAHLYNLYLASFCIGVGQGLMVTNISNISTQLFSGHERSHMYGLQITVESAGSVVLMLVAGYLAQAFGWHGAYYTFLIIIPCLIVFAIGLPKVPPPQAVTIAKKEKAPIAWPPVGVWIAGILIALFCCGYAMFFLNAAFYVMGNELGGPALVGWVMSVSTGAAVVGSLFFSSVLKVLKRYTWALSGVFIIIGFAILTSLPPNKIAAFATAIFIGLGYSMAMPSGIQAVSETASAKALSLSMGIYMAFMALGLMLAPTIMNPLAKTLFGEGSMAAFSTGIVWMIVLVVLLIVWATITRNSAKEVDMNAPEVTTAE